MCPKWYYTCRNQFGMRYKAKRLTHKDIVEFGNSIVNPLPQLPCDKERLSDLAELILSPNGRESLVKMQYELAQKILKALDKRFSNSDVQLTIGDSVILLENDMIPTLLASSREIVLNPNIKDCDTTWTIKTSKLDAFDKIRSIVTKLSGLILFPSDIRSLEEKIERIKDRDDKQLTMYEV